MVLHQKFIREQPVPRGLVELMRRSEASEKCADVFCDLKGEIDSNGGYYLHLADDKTIELWQRGKSLSSGFDWASDVLPSTSVYIHRTPEKLIATYRIH